MLGELFKCLEKYSVSMRNGFSCLRKKSTSKILCTHCSKLCLKTRNSLHLSTYLVARIFRDRLDFGFVTEHVCGLILLIH